jgi:uncharacterized membrane-anchored protein
MRATLAILLLATAGPLVAQSSDEAATSAAEFEASLNFRQGDITLGDGIATLHVSERYRYLGPEDAARLLTEGWGNPPGGRTLGMLFPADVSPLADEGWGVVITFDEDGYVDDDDAAKIDYDKLLREMKAETAQESKVRERQGYGSLALIGWAAPPRYDSVANKLYWAQELSFDESPEHTLNYNIRALGRRGVLVLNAVASMEQMTNIEDDMQEVLALVEFNPGHRYADFVPGTDKVAAYGIGALVAGKVAAKAGFFKALLASLVAMKKFLIAGAIALAAALRRFFGGRREQAAGASGS